MNTVVLTEKSVDIFSRLLDMALKANGIEAYNLVAQLQIKVEPNIVKPVVEEEQVKEREELQA